MKKNSILNPKTILRKYKTQYHRLSENIKSRCSWDEIKTRLTANDNFYLKLAAGLDKKGILFGIDTEGNPLFADGGDQPVLMYKTYFATRKAVYFVRKSKKLVKTGYEMFPYERSDIQGGGPFIKSPEIEMYENYTKKPFITSPKGNEWRCSWLESGEKPSWAGDAIFNPASGQVKIFDEAPTMAGPSRGVRRLLRVKKS